MANARVIAAAGILGLLVPLAGCETQATGEVGFIDGTLSELEATDMDGAYRATIAALQQLGYPIKSEKRGETSSKVESQTDGMPIWITLSWYNEKEIQVRIRVGWIGEQSTARIILSQIKRYL